MKTHAKDAVEDRLEDDDVTVARPLRELLLLLHMFLSVVGILVVLLRHPASGSICLINRNACYYLRRGRRLSNGVWHLSVSHNMRGNELLE